MQAIDLVNNDGVVSKKKQLESAEPVAFKAIQIIKIKEQENVTIIEPVIKKHAEANS